MYVCMYVSGDIRNFKLEMSRLLATRVKILVTISKFLVDCNLDPDIVIFLWYFSLLFINDDDDDIFLLGILTKAKFATLDAKRFLTRHGSFWGVFTFTSEKEKLEQAVQKARLELQLLSWLQQIHLDTYYSKLLSQGINSVDSLIKNHKSDLLRKIVTDDDFKKFQEAVEKQQGHFVDSPPLRGVLMLFSFSWWSIKFLGKFFFYVTNENKPSLLSSTHFALKISRTFIWECLLFFCLAEAFFLSKKMTEITSENYFFFSNFMVKQ